MIRSSAASPAPTSRRRGPILEAALLDAAWAELQERGYAAFTIDGVARRASTSRPVLYRRWPNRPLLALAAIRAHAPSLRNEDFPDTGSLRGDLLAELGLLRDRYEVIGPELLNGLATELDKLPRGTLDALPAVTAEIVARAAERGEIGPQPVPETVLAVPPVLLRHELLLRHSHPSDADLEAMVDQVAIPAIRLAAEGPHDPVQRTEQPRRRVDG